MSILSLIYSLLLLFHFSTYATGDCDTTITYTIFATDLCINLTTSNAPTYSSANATCKGHGSGSMNELCRLRTQCLTYLLFHHT